MPEYLFKELRPRVRNFLLVIITISVLLLITLPFLYPLKLDKNPLSFLILLILVESLPIHLPHGAVSLSYAILIPGTMLFTPTTLIYLIYLANILTDTIIKRRKLFRSLYNAGQITLSVFIANRGYQFLHHLINPSSISANPLIIFFPAAIFVGVNAQLVFTVFAINENISLLSQWQENARWLLSGYFLFSFLGMILVYIYNNFPHYYLGIFFIFLLAIRYFFKQSMKLLMTEKKIKELEQEKAKLELLGEMASKLSHEIKNPLHSIRGFSELLKNKYQSDEKEFAYCHWIITNVERIDRIIKNSLQFTKNAQLNRLPCNVNTIMEKAVQYSAIPKNIKLIKNLDLKIPEGMLDANLLESAFINLITNAIQAIKNSGEITITTNLNGSDIVITVEDSGCGIPEENRLRIFQPFFTTKQEKAGSGLGLAIVKSIVEKHGGKIKVESTLNKGTKFEIGLPFKSSSR